MSKVTSKFQVSIPKNIAERAGIRVGDDIDWEAAGGVLRGNLVKPGLTGHSVAQRLSQFDTASERQKLRQRDLVPVESSERGWVREELYDR